MNLVAGQQDVAEFTTGIEEEPRGAFLEDSELGALTDLCCIIGHVLKGRCCASNTKY